MTSAESAAAEPGTSAAADAGFHRSLGLYDSTMIVVGGMIVYEVTDVMKLLPRVFRAAQTVKDITLTCIHDVCCRMTWEEIRQGQRRGNLDTRLKNAAQQALGDYGVNVIKVQLTDLAPARVLKLFQTTGRDEE